MQKGFIDALSIKRYLQRMGHRVMPHELVSIVRRLDINGDQKIEYEEFVESISPVSPEIERVVRP